MSKPSSVPLYVDLDGTLIFSDCLYESMLALIRKQPATLFRMFTWLAKGGRENLKSEIAERLQVPQDFDPSTLPYNQPLIDWLKAEKAAGRAIHLATASHEKFAQAIAIHLGIFDSVQATNAKINLKGRNKLARMRELEADSPLDYAGDSHADLAIWPHTHAAVVVSRSDKFVDKVRNLTIVAKHFSPPAYRFDWHALSLHSLVTYPIVLVVWLLTLPAFSTSAPHWRALLSVTLGFAAIHAGKNLFSYLLCLGDNRKEQKTVHSPLASGEMPLLHGLALIDLLYLSGLIAALLTGAVATGFFWLTALVSSLFEVLIPKRASKHLFPGLYYALFLAALATISQVSIGWSILLALLITAIFSIPKRP